MKCSTLFYCVGNLFQAGGGATVAKNILENYPFSETDILCVSQNTKLSKKISSNVTVIRLSTPNNRLLLELYNQLIAPIVLKKYSADRVVCLDSIIPLLYKGRIEVFYQMRMFYFEEIDNFSKKIKNYLGIKSIKKADTVFVASNDHKNDLVQNLGCNSNKFTVAYLGADHEFIEKILPKKNITPFFLFISILRPYKNLHRLIDAYILLAEKNPIHELPDLKIIGSSPNYKGQNQYLSELHDKIKKANLENKIQFIGKLPFEEVITYLKAASAMVFPTLFEGFGLPLLEGMAAKVPVIVSDRNSLPEIGGDTVMYINPEDISSIYGAMQKVVNKDYPMDKIELAYERSKKFNWINTVNILAQGK